ncbi:MAG: sugar phosphate isomerase/epimerase [Kiritimatiellaeota bacterium]|nr:sugar phosphate isomerase/epimerase [Kiritimatiellota bacterium]
MIKIGNMLWRIGKLLDFDQQLAWTRDAGFDGVGFHASAGIPGDWRGIEPSACTAGERKRLRKEIGKFAFAEIHAPFKIELQSKTLSSGITALAPVLELAQDLGAGTVTVHALVSDSDANSGLAGWLVPMQTLNAQAIQAKTKVALEIVAGFDKVMGWGLSNVGVNLDVGHMYSPSNRQTLSDAGGIGNLIRHIGSTLIHLHLHDIDGDTDHIEIGTGKVAFEEIAAALQAIGYQHNATLELNPDRVSPEGVRRSAEYVRCCLREVKTG